MTHCSATISNMLRSKEKASLAKAVTRLVKSHPLPRKEIALLCKVADGSIGQMMYGKGNPTLDSIIKVAAFFKVPAIRLLQDDQEASHPASVQEPLALYHSDPRLNELIASFSQLTTADQEEFLLAMRDRAAKNAEIVKELSNRNSPAAAAFKPAISDRDVERKMRLGSAPR